MDQIEDKVEGSGLYAVYTDYESDEHGEYTFVVGVGVCSNDSNKDHAGLTLNSGAYAVFTAETKEQVAPVWQQIWQTDLQRTYVSDFEYYDLTTGGVKIYVGIQAH